MSVCSLRQIEKYCNPSQYAQKLHVKASEVIGRKYARELAAPADSFFSRAAKTTKLSVLSGFYAPISSQPTPQRKPYGEHSPFGFLAARLGIASGVIGTLCLAMRCALPLKCLGPMAAPVLLALLAGTGVATQRDPSAPGRKQTFLRCLDVLVQYGVVGLPQYAALRTADWAERRDKSVVAHMALGASIVAGALLAAPRLFVALLVIVGTLECRLLKAVALLAAEIPAFVVFELGGDRSDPAERMLSAPVGLAPLPPASPAEVEMLAVTALSLCLAANVLKQTPDQTDAHAVI
jgi:hypothetical protein